MCSHSLQAHIIHKICLWSAWPPEHCNSFKFTLNELQSVPLDKSIFPLKKGLQTLTKLEGLTVPFKSSTTRSLSDVALFNLLIKHPSTKKKCANLDQAGRYDCSIQVFNNCSLRCCSFQPLDKAEEFANLGQT